MSGPARSALADSLTRIAAFDGDIKAFARLDAAGAELTAGDLDRRAGEGEDVGPLLGFTLGIKDVIDTAGLITACGSPIFAGRLPADDATVVSRIRAAGGLIVGKTVTTEFATFDPPPTRNPWRLDHTPGGSSAGSAAAVAAGMVRAAVGTQTAGSVIRPAAYCGVVGYVPSPGWISRQGVYPCSWSLDRVGLFARTVDDVVTTLNVVVEGAPGDSPARSGSNGGEDRSDPVRIGVPATMLARASAGTRRAVGAVAEGLAGLGWIVEEVEAPASFEAGFGGLATIMRAEMATIHRDLYRRHGRRYAPRVASLIEAGLRTRAVDYLAAQRLRDRYRSDLDALLGRVGALLLPSAVGPAERGHASTGDPVMSIPATFGGLPAITLPATLSRSGLPIGVQLVGSRDRDGSLLGLALDVERLLAFDRRTMDERWAPVSREVAGRRAGRR